MLKQRELVLKNLLARLADAELSGLDTREAAPSSGGTR
jgi:hypothetical protein